MAISERIIDIPDPQIHIVFGQFDEYLKKIEKALNISVFVRNDEIKLVGSEKAVECAIRVFAQLTELAKRNEELTHQQVDYAISLSMENSADSLAEIDKDIICHTINGKPIKPKTIGQRDYIEAIQNKMVVFGIGPAGTGKTYLAMAMAIKAFKSGEISRIILTRPAIEAGEKLGFLPGDLQSKIDPYLRPLYDALYQIMGPDAYLKNTEKGLIEVAPLAYMRGRTLDNAFIILDEAQNTTPAQMKMFLTRMGFGSKVVVTGDSTQKDLPKGTVSGLDVAKRVLSRVDEIAFCELTSRDVVRHPLVQKIVDAYERYEASGRQQQQKTYNREKR